MNRENIQKLIDQLKHVKHAHFTQFRDDGLDNAPWFSMNYFSFPKYYRQDEACGTPGCIAGWACQLSSTPHWWELHDLKLMATAAEWLGIDREWARENLFLPEELETEFDELTPEHAITALTNILKLGDDYMSCNIHELWGLF